MYELLSSYNIADDIIVARMNTYQCDAVKLVLSTMTRIVVDIAKSFNEKPSSFNITAISPSYSYLIYRAGIHILLTADISDEKIQLDFYELRKFCWYVSHRWLIAGLFLPM